MDDSSIMKLLIDRDEKAIAELKDKYGRICMYIAGNVLSQHEDAEECVNTAFYELWNRIPPSNPDDLKAYLCRIVRNIALNRLEYYSAAKRDYSLTVSLDEISDCVPSAPDSQISVNELADAISRFLRTQDAIHRKVFVRRYEAGDFNTDGVIDARDASDILKYYCAKSTNAQIRYEFEVKAKYLGDVTYDKIVDARDASEVLVIYSEKATS